MTRTRTILAGLFALAAALPARAQTPEHMAFEGYLTDASGAPLTGARTLVFALYEAATGGTAIWSETLTADVRAGVVMVTLGETEPLDATVFDGQTALWLGIRVGADAELTPRFALTAVPYAARAEVASFAENVPTIEDIAEELATGGALVSGAALDDGDPATAPVGWRDLRDVPAGFADGTDDGLSGEDVAALLTSGSYVTIETLASYVTGEELAAALGAYLTPAELEAALAGYVTPADLVTALAGHVTPADLATALAGYVTPADLATALADRPTNEELAVRLAERAAVEHGHALSDIEGIPASCDDGEVPKYDALAGVFTCGVDFVGADAPVYGAREGGGLELGGGQFGLVGSCSDGELLKWDAATGAWACRPDADTDTDTRLEAFPGGGLEVTGAAIGLAPCGPGELLKWDGAAWLCAADLDLDTIYAAAEGGGLELRGTAFALRAGCPDGALLKWSAETGEWLCGVDETGPEATRYTAAPGGGLVLTGTAFGLTGACAAGQILKWDAAAAAWACAGDVDTDTRYSAGTGLALTGTTFAVDPTSVQRRVTGSCQAGESLRSVGADGSVTCEPDDDRLGSLSCRTSELAKWNGTAWVCAPDTDTTYTAGSGMTLTGTAFAVNTAAIQARVAGTCAAGQSIRAIDTAGAVTCEADDNTTYTAGTGLTLAGTAFAVNTAAIQARVSGTCAAGQSIRAIDAAGAVTCEADDNALGGLTCTNGQVAEWSGTGWVCGTDTDTTYGAGAGLTLSGTTFAVNTTAIQARVTGTCAAGQAIRTIDAAGVVTCEADDNTLGSLTCAAGEVAKWSGSAWVCAPDLDLHGAIPQVPVANAETVVDTSSVNGTWTSVTVGADGLPILSYYAPAGGLYDLRVAKCANAACTIAATSVVDSTGDVGTYSSIAIGVDGLPIVSYYDATNGDLKIAKCGDAACRTATTRRVDGSTTGPVVGQYTAIAIGGDGLPAIAYYDVTNGDLKFAHCEDPACATATVAALDTTGTVGQYVSMAIGVSGYPVIAYYDATSLVPKAIVCYDAKCGTGSPAIVDTSRGSGQWTSVTIGNDGLPIIAYFDSAGKVLKVARCGSPDYCGQAGWVQVPPLGDIEESGRYTAISVPADGLPIIAHQIVDNLATPPRYALRMTKCAAPDCGTVLSQIDVDTPDQVGLYNSIVTGTDGLPLVSYYDASAARLKALHCANAFCRPFWTRR